MTAAQTTTAPRPSAVDVPTSAATARRRRAEAVAGTWIPLAFVVLGAGLRIRQYVFRRSLWNDEAALALNIVQRGFVDLLRPLRFQQGAPIGFLWVERAAVDVLGKNEYALRLFPLLAGIAGLVLFALIARRVLSPWATPFAVLLFAVLQPLVYYSTEVKQYGVDVTAALLIAYMTLRLLDRPLTRRRALVWGGVGGATLFVSHPAALVLGASGLALGLTLARRHERQQLEQLAWGVGVFAAAFIVEYVVSLRNLSANQVLAAYWHDGYPPQPFHLDKTLAWIGGLPGRLVPDPLAVKHSVALYVLAAVGLAGLAWRRPTVALLLAGIVGAALCAAFVRAYPVQWRLALYLVPFVLLAAAAAIDVVIHAPLPLRLLAIVPAAALVFVAVTPTSDALSAIGRPYTRTELRPVLEKLAARRHPGDLIYVHWTGLLLFDYYSPLLHLRRDGTLGFAPRAACDDGASLARLENHRVWLVFAFPPGYDSADSAGATLAHMDRLGTRLFQARARGHAEVDLYALSNRVTGPAPAPPHPGLCINPTSP